MAGVTWERVICPACGKDVSVSPKSREMRSHDNQSRAFCSGSGQTVENARLDSTEIEESLYQGACG